MNGTPINILLADDDKDDCLFFKDALDELALAYSLTMVHNCEQLMEYLETVSPNLPNAIFLDLNMPRKNGFECLTEIKEHAVFSKIPVIIYSTSYDEEKASLLYKTGAHYYIIKPADFEELKNVVQRAIMLVSQNSVPSTQENFYIYKFKEGL